MAKTFKDRLKAKQEAKFIGRSEHLTVFNDNLKATDPLYSIINIYGQGGVGKSYLSQQYKTIAEQNKCLTAYTDEDTKSVLQWMERVAQQFKNQEAELTEFEKNYKTYQQETKKLESDPEKPKGTWGGFMKALTKGAIKEVKKLPGAELIEEEKYDKALEYYKKVLNTNADNYEVYYNIGNTYFKKSEYENAVENYEKAIKIKPDYHYAYGSLGFYQIINGSLKEAESLLLKAIELDNMATSNMNLGHVYLCENEEEKAIKCYQTSFNNFENKADFWKGMKDDYQYLAQYGITEAYYQTILEKIRENTEVEIPL
jgi:tetratricopeptide (TPR) repeat protein